MSKFLTKILGNGIKIHKISRKSGVLTEFSIITLNQ